jgi:hypothetical protein
MLQKIQKIKLAQAPETICTTTEELSAKMQQKFGSNKICMFIGQLEKVSWFIYAMVDKNDQVDMSNVIAFPPPCPPYCGKGDGNLYALV